MKEFDRIIRNKMRKAEAPYPSDMWQRIQSNLPEKKRKIYPVWLMASVLLVSMGALAFWLQSEFSGNRNSVQAGSKSSLALLAPTSQRAHNLNENFTDDTAGQNQVQDKAIQSSDFGAYSSASSESYTTPNVANMGRRSNDGHYHINTVTSNSTSGLSLSNHQISASKDANVSQNSPIEATTSKATEEEEITNSAQKLTRRGEKVSAPTIAGFLRVFGTDQSDVIEDINNTMKKHALLQCPTFVRKENLSFFELYFSNDFAIRSMHERSSEYAGYRALRENTEQSYLSYSAGFRVGLGWDNGIAVKTGLNYSGINEKFTYTDPNSMQIKTITIIKYIYDDQFNIIDSIKTTENVSIPGTNTVTHYNRISMLDIPVLFQYTIPGRRRLSYSLVCGPLINLSLVQSGKILAPEGNRLINLGEQNIYKNNVGLSLYGGIGINYQLTKNIQMAIEPNVRLFTGSMSKVTQPVEQKYLVASVAAAFRYKI